MITSFTAQLAAVPMMAWYIFSNRRGPELRSIAGHLTTAVRLSPAPMVTDGGGAVA